MEILLIRHGETAWNREGIFRGRMDIPLNETGLQQAKLLSEYLADEPIEAVYSSPLSRALETAGAIAGIHGLDMEPKEELVDMDFGIWQGLPVETVEKEFPELFRRWQGEPEKVMIPGGESLDEVKDRAMRLVQAITGSHSGKVVLASHRVIIKVLVCALLGLDNSHFWNIRQDTCGITTFSCRDGRFILTGHNDTSFLKSFNHGKLADF